MRKEGSSHQVSRQIQPAQKKVKEKQKESLPPAIAVLYREMIYCIFTFLSIGDIASLRLVSTFFSEGLRYHLLKWLRNIGHGEFIQKNERLFYMSPLGQFYLWSTTYDGFFAFVGNDLSVSEDAIPLLPKEFLNKQVQQLEVEGESIYCLTDDGLYVWGGNQNAQLGLGHRDKVVKPRLSNNFSVNSNFHLSFA